MKENEMIRSRRLSETILIVDVEPVALKSYWCRVVYEKNETFNVREHCHSFFELHLCRSGKCTFCVDGEEIVLTPDTYLLLPPYQNHRICDQSEDFSKFAWGFSVQEEKIAENLKNGCEKIFIRRAERRMVDAIDILLENMDGDIFEFYPVIKGQLYYIFVLLVRQSTALKAERSYRKTPSMEMESVIKFISNNLAKDVSTEEIAAQFYMSRGRLERMCREECHCSVSQLKWEVQREKIRNLLSQSNLTLKEIAEQTGFSDQYAMGKFFKKHEGEPPGQYRRSSKK